MEPLHGLLVAQNAATFVLLKSGETQGMGLGCPDQIVFRGAPMPYANP